MEKKRGLRAKCAKLWHLHFYFASLFLKPQAPELRSERGKYRLTRKKQWKTMKEKKNDKDQRLKTSEQENMKRESQRHIFIHSFKQKENDRERKRGDQNREW